jgi:hypothetical protein
MYSLIFLVPLIPLAYAFRHSPGWLFLCIYLPALLLIPDAFRTVTAGIPKVNINQAVIMTILPFVLIRYGRNWRFSVTDALVFALMALMSVSEFQAAGYKEAQNLTFAMLSSALAPYLVARLVIPAEDLDVATARRFVILLFAVAIISLFEFKFGWNPFLVLIGKLFPGQGTGWVTTFRHGFARIAGPYAHAILAGIMMAVAYRLQRWLQWGGHWETHFARLPNLPWKKASVITFALFMGALMTIARGPWLGGIAGAIPLLIARSKNRRRMMMITGVLLLVVVPVAYFGFMSYLDVKPGMAITSSQESAMYRKVLIEKYVVIALDHAALGWGRNTWPKVPGMASIDNYFLLLALMHGVIASAILIMLFLWQGARLAALGMREPAGTNSLALTHLGILIAIFMSIVTVYLGEQAIPVFFIILGWSEAVVNRGVRTAHPADSPVAQTPTHAFRVML